LVGLEIASSKNDFANTDSNPPQQQLGFLQFKSAGGTCSEGLKSPGKKVVKKTNNKTLHCTCVHCTATVRTTGIQRYTPQTTGNFIEQQKKRHATVRTTGIQRYTPQTTGNFIEQKKKDMLFP
jgi:hypothetical protein